MSDVARSYVLPAVKQNFSEVSNQNLMTARIDLVRIFPFFGFLIMTTEYYFTDEVDTMAATTVGGNKIYVNEEFCNSLSRKERAFVIAHEVMHIFLEHIGRQTENNYNAQVWNIAADFCINSHLIELKESRIEMPKMGLHDTQYKEMSADEIYHKLMKDADNDPDKVTEQFGDGEGEGSSGKRPFDELGAIPTTEAQKAENRQKVAAALGQSDIDAIKKMGDGYAALIRQFEDLLESKIPWQQVLREFIVSNSKNRYTYNRVSRKSYGNRVTFPTLTGDNVNLVFGVDTSGSMSNKDIAEAVSELHSICEEFDEWHVTLMSCDTQAHIIGEYDTEDGDDFLSIDLDLVGGGGTSLEPMIEYSNEMEEPASVIVIITDGYIPVEPYENAIEDIPVITIVTSSGASDLEINGSTVIKMNEV